MTREWTIADIRRANLAAGGHFFDRATMRTFRDTLRNFSVRHEGARMWVVRVRVAHDRDGNPVGGVGGVGARWEFEPDTGRLHPVREDVAA